MGYKYMEVAPVGYGAGGRFAYEVSVALAAAGDSDDFLVPPDVNQVAFTVKPAGGATGKVQVTTDKVSIVKAGTADWTDWDLGAVSSIKSDASVPVTAFRFVQANTGTLKGTARAQ